MLVRSSYLLAAAAIIALVLPGCGTIVRGVRQQTSGFVAPPPSDLARARTAWAYFAAATPAETVAGAGFTSPDAMADDIAATMAAWRIGLINTRTYDTRMATLLALIAAAPLSQGILPGRFYDLRGAKLIDPPGRKGDPGWSGLEIGRLLVWLHIVAAQDKKHANAAKAIVARWPLCRAVNAAGRLMRAIPTLAPAVEVGSGYADYAVLGFQSWGVAAKGSGPPPGDFSVSLEGIDVPIDSEGNPEPVLTAPLALIAIEFGWLAPDGSRLDALERLGNKIAEIQQRRFAGSGVLTARSDYRRASSPYIIFDSVLTGGFPWRTLDDMGNPYPVLASVSVRAAFGIRALRPDDGYGDRIVGEIDGLQRAGGWAEGRHEVDGRIEAAQSSATNAFVLEAVWQRQAGPLRAPQLTSLPMTDCQRQVPPRP